MSPAPFLRYRQDTSGTFFPFERGLLDEAGGDRLASLFFFAELTGPIGDDPA